MPLIVPRIWTWSAGRPPTRSDVGAESCLEVTCSVRLAMTTREKRRRSMSRSALRSVRTIRYWLLTLSPTSITPSSTSSIFFQLLGTATRLCRSVAVTTLVVLGLTALPVPAAVVTAGVARLPVALSSAGPTSLTAMKTMAPTAATTARMITSQRVEERRRLEGGAGGAGHVDMGAGPFVRAREPARGRRSPTSTCSQESNGPAGHDLATLAPEPRILLRACPAASSGRCGPVAGGAVVGEQPVPQTGVRALLVTGGASPQGRLLDPVEHEPKDQHRHEHKAPRVMAVQAALQPVGLERGGLWGVACHGSAPGDAGRAERRREEVLLAVVWAGDEGAGVHHQRPVVEPEIEAVHPTRRRSLDVLPSDVEHRAVARALEAPGALAERHATAEVRAPLGQGEIVPVRVDEPEPALREVGRGPRLEVGRVAQRDAPARARPGERAQRLEGGPPERDTKEGAPELPAPAQQLPAVELHGDS